MTKYLLPLTYTLSAADVAELTRAQRKADGVRITRGAYLSRAAEPSLALEARAALDVLPLDAVASHRTAAALLGAPVRSGRPLTFAVGPETARPRRAGLRFHTRTLSPGDRATTDGIPVTSGSQTFLDLAPELPSDELVAVGDALYRCGHLDAASLATRLMDSAGTRGVVRARECAPLLSPLAASRPESLFRSWLHEAGLPAPRPQCPICDDRGRVVAHTDLGYEQWQVALEYEGRHHAERDQFGRDLTRYSYMGARGWLLLRFGERDLDRRASVIDRVAGALRSRGARW